MNITITKSVSNAILIAPYQLNIWLGCFILITGNISTIGNIIIFSSRSFRNRACTIYLLAEAFVLIFFFNFVLLTRTLQKGFEIPLLNRYDIICRLRYFASQYTNLLAINLFIFASLDRLLSTHRSPAFRKWSGQINLAYKLVLVCTIIWLIISCHRLIFYSALTGQCIAQQGFYATFDNYFEAIVSGFCPPIIILILAYLLMQSVRSTIQRQTILVNTVHSRSAPNLTFLRKTDKQLTRMLLWQTFVAIPAFLPYAGELIYTNITRYWSKSDQWLAWEDICTEIIRLLSYTFFSTRFYVTLMSSDGIREKIFNIFGMKNRINPINEP
ncbi:unnamed protein product [Adineta steineri]|uniref:G-protein coupled receptors family 1 profile domain-containing protein n=1 Tax=Adineta steineri TaxID=433720 RepID=A0A819KQE4_9BILA|nr:unnamed protein product [Adineta steineri]CAF0885399.1 unnamed protein product [Adineta steineri]CAF3683023.1 unnamed protein product [Adineta steineri]CAF3952693.1 unnamed protein product [Adineta steineri]